MDVLLLDHEGACRVKVAAKHGVGHVQDRPRPRPLEDDPGLPVVRVPGQCPHQGGVEGGKARSTSCTGWCSGFNIGWSPQSVSIGNEPRQAKAKPGQAEPGKAKLSQSQPGRARSSQVRPKARGTMGRLQDTHEGMDQLTEEMEMRSGPKGLAFNTP